MFDPNHGTGSTANGDGALPLLAAEVQPIFFILPIDGLHRSRLDAPSREGRLADAHLDKETGRAWDCRCQRC
jgi:hypothetical protein